MQHRLKTELFSVVMKHIYTYTMTGVHDRKPEREGQERDRQTDKRERQKRETRERDEREKTGIRSVRLEDCFSTWTGVNGSKGHKQQTSQQHYFKKKNF